MFPVVRYCRLLILAVALFVSDLAWGGVQPGETITKETMTQAEDLLTPATRWMLERGMPMPVIATKKVEWPKAYREASDKYASQVKLSSDGRELVNYVAGAPFPEINPKDSLAGFRIVWNQLQGPYQLDNMGTDLFGARINSKGGVERVYETLWRRLLWTGRLYREPLPQIPHAPAIRYTNLFGPYRFPIEHAGLTVLDIHYASSKQADETYAYYPERRKVTHVSAADRGGPLAGILGSDYDIDSFLGFNGNIHHWDFRLLAEKEILAVVHSGKYGDRSARCAPRDGTHGIVAALPCVSWEKRWVWIVEGTPTNFSSLYAYSKRVLYIDRDFFFPLITELYDQRGELWKGLLHCVFSTKKPYVEYPAKPLDGMRYQYAEEMPFIPNWVLVDFQQAQATSVDAPPAYKQPSEWQTEWYFNGNGPMNTPEAHSVTAFLEQKR